MYGSDAEKDCSVADDALLMLPGEQSLYGSADEILTPENLFEAYGVRIDAVAGKASRRLIPDFEIKRGTLPQT